MCFTPLIRAISAIFQPLTYYDLPDPLFTQPTKNGLARHVASFLLSMRADVLASADARFSQPLDL